jgi:predicted histone-like DNA-binding protein
LRRYEKYTAILYREKSLAVPYVIIERDNPLNPTVAKKFYAQAKGRKAVTFRAICKEIAGASTTVSDTDALAVLNDLIKVLRRHLNEGEIVRFGDFGTFQVSLSSSGAETAAQFNASLIKKPKVAFRPGIDLRDMLATLKYEKI